MVYRKYMKLFLYRVILLSCLGLSGCAPISFDETRSKATQSLVTGCYRTDIESYLYHQLKNKDTYLIQTGMPFNEWETGSYGKTWKSIVEVPVGTQFRVTRVLNQYWGNGRRWLIYGRFADATLFDQEFIIPSGNYAQTGQIWISPVSPLADDNPPRLESYFVRSC
jgi:hypothetical protein